MAAMTTGAKRSAGWPRRPRSVVSLASIPPETKDTAQRRVYSTPAKMGSWPIWPTRRSLPRLSAHAQACSMDQSRCTPWAGFSTVPRPKRGCLGVLVFFFLGCGSQVTIFPDYRINAARPADYVLAIDVEQRGLHLCRSSGLRRRSPRSAMWQMNRNRTIFQKASNFSCFQGAVFATPFDCRPRARCS